jgi:hypothetical protein
MKKKLESRENKKNLEEVCGFSVLNGAERVGWMRGEIENFD